MAVKPDFLDPHHVLVAGYLVFPYQHSFEIFITRTYLHHHTCTIWFTRKSTTVAPHYPHTAYLLSVALLNGRGRLRPGTVVTFVDMLVTPCARTSDIHGAHRYSLAHGNCSHIPYQVCGHGDTAYSATYHCCDHYYLYYF